MNFTDYLNALDLMPPQQPSLDFLCTLTERHIGRFTFNNLAVLLQEDISLECQAVLNKVVHRGVGGYCFEHNKLAYEALSYWGYKVRIVLARIINNNERAVPRTHRITLVEIEGKRYLVDVGFGANCPIAPIALDSQAIQSAGFEHYQIQQNTLGEFELWQQQEAGPFLLYRFDLAHYTDADCDMGHFYSHKNPAAVFVNNLVVSQKNATDTFVVTNQHLQHRTNAGTKSSLLESPQALYKALRQIFNLTIEQEVCEFLFAHYIAPRLTNTIERHG
ncbi:arylamine N-acetyltransferase family protein [Marinomonas fungiae]|uniref:arylamine N-acetyltransferase family protein n=1 Tax=Marinomonas fungiae TaxID=1137284 RepID=UPI003A9445BE